MPVRADNAQQQQAIPQNPLEQSAPKPLYFTVEFMQAYAESKWPGTTYAGIAFESERPVLTLQVPDGGRLGFACLHHLPKFPLAISTERVAMGGRLLSAGATFCSTLCTGRCFADALSA